MTPAGLLATLSLAAVAGLFAAPAARAQSPEELSPLLTKVMPTASRFAEKQGTPLVYRAFGTDAATGKETLIGYAFLTSDMPPEERGYSGPIKALVGMDLQGKLTGVAVVDYYESLRGSRGDFLRSTRFLNQFAGKGVADAFRVRRDIDGLSGATISVSAMARGIRNSSRRVAVAYVATNAAVPEPLHPGTVTAEKIDALNWLDMVDGGLAQKITLLDKEDRFAIDVSLVYLRNDSIAVALMGSRALETVKTKMADRTDNPHLMMVGVDGPLGALFRATAMYVIQGSDTVRITQKDLHMLGIPSAGKVDGQFANLGVLLVNRSIDADKPFTAVLDLRPGMGFATTEFPGLIPPPAPRLIAAAPAASGDSAAVDSMADSAAAVNTAEQQELASIETAVETAMIDALAQEDLDFENGGETLLARTLADTSWWRVGWFAVVLALASAAFALKRKVPLRWVSLGATLAFLGFVDGGFLSVSHITSGIKVGPSVYLSDLPLLMLVSFTLVTTLLWGRVFCGYLCPFGALQDFMERIVPKRFRRELPRWMHERALLVKYSVLVLVLAPAIAGSNISIFEYFEPFGTVFFFSTSIVLWSIAAAILLAVAVVPRFYCRYVCPLGAALAVVSTISPFKIKRVPQCELCKVCEQHCPTGAISGPDIDFKECVRCNICETALIEKVGVCKHDMEDVRPRLVKLKMASR